MTKPIDYFCSESLRHDLKGRTVRGGALTAAMQGLKVVIGLATIPMLARLLDPEDFGLVAIVTVFTGFASMFVDAGLSTATVQRSDISHRQASNLFWIATGLGVVIALLASALAPAIGWIYAEPRLTPITIALTCSFVMSGLTVQHQALMRRGMQFRDLAVADVVSQVLSQVVGIGWAWLYYEQTNDYWALVLIPLVAAFVRMVLTCVMCTWRPGLPSRGAGTRQLVEFGANLTGGGFINYFARNADKAAIGWYWGDAALGFYANAYRVLLFPLTAINGPISNVAIPALSRLKDQPEAYRSFFRRGIEIAMLLLVPAVAASLVLAEPLVLTVLGPNWGPAIPIFLAFGPAALAQTTAPATAWVFLSWGHAGDWMRMVIFNTCCVLLGFAIALPYGSFWVAISLSIVVCVIRIPSIYIAFRPTPLSWNDILQPMTVPVIASLVASLGSIAWCVRSDPAAPAFNRLASGMALFGSVYAAAVIATPSGRFCLTQAIAILRQQRPPTPDVLD